MTQEDFNFQLGKRNPSNQTSATKLLDKELLEFAAKNGLLDNIPQDLFDLENMLAVDENDWNLFHFAAANGQLKNVPLDFLTRDNLLQENSTGETCLHILCKGSQDFSFLNKVPFNVDDYLIIDKNGAICLEYAVSKFPAQFAAEVATEAAAKFNTGVPATDAFNKSYKSALSKIRTDNSFKFYEKIFDQLLEAEDLKNNSKVCALKFNSERKLEKLKLLRKKLCSSSFLTTNPSPYKEIIRNHLKLRLDFAHTVNSLTKKHEDII